MAHQPKQACCRLHGMQCMPRSQMPCPHQASNGTEHGKGPRLANAGGRLGNAHVHLQCMSHSCSSVVTQCVNTLSAAVDAGPASPMGCIARGNPVTLRGTHQAGTQSLTGSMYTAAHVCRVAALDPTSLPISQQASPTHHLNTL